LQLKSIIVFIADQNYLRGGSLIIRQLIWIIQL